MIYGWQEIGYFGKYRTATQWATNTQNKAETNITKNHNRKGNPLQIQNPTVYSQHYTVSSRWSKRATAAFINAWLKLTGVSKVGETQAELTPSRIEHDMDLKKLPKTTEQDFANPFTVKSVFG